MSIMDEEREQIAKSLRWADAELHDEVAKLTEELEYVEDTDELYGNGLIQLCRVFNEAVELVQSLPPGWPAIDPESEFAKSFEQGGYTEEAKAVLARADRLLQTMLRARLLGLAAVYHEETFGENED